jgi:hypothetical protein
MFNALGVGYGGSLIGDVATLLTPIPFIFYKYGRAFAGDRSLRRQKTMKKQQVPETKNQESARPQVK